MKSTTLFPLVLLLQSFAGITEGAKDEDKSPTYQYTCYHKIYCQGVDPDQFFHLCAKLCNNTGYTYKQYANLRLQRSPDEIEIRQTKLVKRYLRGDKMDAKDVFTRFRDDNFAHGGELLYWTPTDFKTDPRFVNMIKNKNVRAFATTVITFWPTMGRKIAPNVSANQEYHSLIYVPNGFMVAANESEEWRYFDNYWILEGILISRMFVTAKGILNNMVYLLEKFGYIPSGSRVYYLDRSHPPLLAKMVTLYVNRTNDLPWLRLNIDKIAQELDYWLTQKFTSVTVNNVEYKLAQYTVRSRGLRPENLVGDANMTEPVKEYRRSHLNEIKSAAESGWEFSSRWIFNQDAKDGPLDGRKGHPRYSNLSRIIPVDLNALLYGAFFDISRLYDVVGRRKASETWASRAQELVAAIRAVHWNETDGTWYDYDITKKTHRAYFYASNLVPLWTRAYPNSSDDGVRRGMGSKAAKYLWNEGIPQYEGGIPASTLFTKEEWDFPNAWAPSQSMIIQGLWDTGDDEALQLAEQFASKWIKTAYLGYKRDRCLYANYDVTSPGTSSYYVKQDRPVDYRTGYGWTNGFLLSLMHSFVFPYGTLEVSTAVTNSANDAIFYLSLLVHAYEVRIFSF